MGKKLHIPSTNEVMEELIQKSITPESASLLLTPFIQQIDRIVDDVKNMTDLTCTEIRARLMNALKRSASSLEMESINKGNVQNILYRDLQEASSKLPVRGQFRIFKYSLPKEKTKDQIEDELALNRRLNASAARVIRSTRGLA